MSKQSELELENILIKQLYGLNYKAVTITDEKELLANLKTQLEKHNNTVLSDRDFVKVVNHLNKGNIFERAKTLRDKMHLKKEDETSVYLDFLNQEQPEKNIYQVTNQITMEGSYKNRYDVTLLVNGLPLVQIELKRRGLEMKEAFNQTLRYKQHSYGAGSGLFQYIQLFVISNGVNTKYYSNNRHRALSYKQTFFWADVKNNKIANLTDFANVFLEPHQLSTIISKYIVLQEADKILMVLRPYQYFATELIVNAVKTGKENGYIWHTTGSGKTLTSFKASQILMKLPAVHKVVFVVDRKDLDYQTTKEFNSFSQGSVDGTADTKALVKQFADDTKLIVTTIQKLNNAVASDRYASTMAKLKDERLVFIFDECHRSQFGETHGRIVKYFNNTQMFGFTGTPIFEANAAKNALGKRTTKDLFNKCLHKYVITDAIRDENVLKFQVEYVGRYRQKDSANEIDIEVNNIDTKELLESHSRLNKITDYIIDHYGQKTHNKTYTAMFCVSNVDTLIKYYNLFKHKKTEGKHNLRIATIFSYGTNEDDKFATGETFNDEEEETITNPKHTRDSLEEFIGDYNTMYGSAYSTKDTQSYYNYYNDIAKRVKAKQIDILLVVNMFLTGFDSKTLNTLFVDKNLKYHGLIQAYSRTNRILDEKKSQGNIVVFRNLKKATDEAITLFSNKESKEVIFTKPYTDVVDELNEAIEGLLRVTPTPESVDSLRSETEELEFVILFRKVLRLRNSLATHADFDFTDTIIEEQTFEDFKSKYLDIKPTGKEDEGKTSILEDVDFELELLHRDEVNVAYILQLLVKLKHTNPEEHEAKRQEITNLLSGDAKLRSKKELIEKFIDENLVEVTDSDNIPEEFDRYWDKEKLEALNKLSEEEKLIPSELQSVIDNYIFTERKPLNDDVVKALQEKPKLLERKKVASRVIDRIVDFVDTFIKGMNL